MLLIRRACLMVMLFAAVSLTAGCAHRPPAGGAVSPPPAAAALNEEKIVVARVNGAGITLRALNELMGRMKSLDRETDAPASPEEARKKALDQLVLQELALQEAARQGVSVNPRDIDSAITVLVGHEQKDYEAFLAKRNMTDAEFRGELGRGMLLQQMLSREVTAKAVVSEDETRKEYERLKDRLIAPEKVSVVDVTVSPKLGDKAARKKASEIIARIKADLHEDPHNLEAGDFTVRDRDLEKDKEPALYDAARKLKVAELSGAIPAPDGVHILKLSAYAPERHLPYEEVKGPLEAKLKADAMKKRREEWEQELKKGAKIEILDAQVQK
jgi:parvulin-like peptidyl-prolyl isomerase